MLSNLQTGEACCKVLVRRRLRAVLDGAAGPADSEAFAAI